MTSKANPAVNARCRTAARLFAAKRTPIKVSVVVNVTLTRSSWATSIRFGVKM